MLLITCPYCQEEREETEFSFAGEAFIARPEQPENLTDEQWADYLFYRTNHKGNHHEQWNHTHGCRKYFVVKRSTIDNTIEGSWTMDDAAKLSKTH